MPDEATTKAIEHIRAVNGAVDDAVANLGPLQGLGPVEQVAARFGAFGYRQVQAIVTLSEASDNLQVQIGQLVRSLLEIWFYAAWMLAPETAEDRRKRVNGLVRNGTTAHRDKLVYQSVHFPATPPDHLEFLDQYIEELDEEIAAH
jgi:hypothetical protein